MITKKSILTVVVAYLIFHPGIAPPANAMMPLGDSDHRNLYKMQGWIWENHDQDLSTRSSSLPPDAPAGTSSQESSQESRQEATYPTIHSHLLTIDLAFGMPTHPPTGDLAFGLPTHPPTGDLAFGMPTHPPTGDLAFGRPTHPPTGDLAFRYRTRRPSANLA